MIDAVVSNKGTQYHIMKMNIDSTEFVNPGQTTVSASDQPFFAKKHQLLWEFNKSFSKSIDCNCAFVCQCSTYSMKLFPFFGPMHIEMNILSCHGELIRGTGLEEILKTAGLNTVGLTVA